MAVMKDNANVYVMMGASNHSKRERQSEDYYATPPIAVEHLLELEKFNDDIWEPACGEGHISEVLKAHGYKVVSTDIVDRNYGGIGDFLAIDNIYWHGDIITNPPYKYAKEFVEKALSIIPDGHKVAMFLKLQFLEGKDRRVMFDKYPPKTIYVSSSRMNCGLNGVFDKASAVCYCWYIWERGFHGDPIIKWFN